MRQNLNDARLMRKTLVFFQRDDRLGLILK